MDGGGTSFLSPLSASPFVAESMRAILPSSFIGLVLLACGSAVAAPSSAVDCADRESRVSIKPVARQELDIEGGKFSYGVFVISNGASKPVSLYADVRAEKYWMVHPNSIVLQRDVDGEWKDYVGSLSEYARPSKTVIIHTTDEWQFLYLLDEVIGSGASRTQLFRLILVDIAKCNIPSEPFSLESLEKSEALR